MAKWFGQLKLAILLFLTSAIAAPDSAAIAQLIPDPSLGGESSRVTPSGVRTQISGGAIRDTTVFHSFREFNVNNKEQVYFTPPNGIANIFTRVTGSNISRIFGTLGVNGGANLFLINPLGIIFGPNAKLDIAGSFTATTARSVIFDNYTFSANNPTAPPLLKINVTPGLQYGAIEPDGQISSEGNLSVGQDLNLIGGNLNLQGQLGAGENLNLAGNTVNILDSIGKPFIATARGNLLVQGQKLDIFALNHPDSGLFSGGDMVLQSSNTVAGDAHYTSGGSFRIEQPDGSLGGLFSTYDPVIRTGGDVLIGRYTGASLHILAGGKVEIPNIIINGADTTQGLLETLRLSDGTSVAIAGNTTPTLDIRAGVDPAAIAPTIPAPGTPGFSNQIYSNTPTSADIKVGTILFADTANNPIAGQVLLTNQYRPNPNLSGDIQINGTAVTGGGAVNIDSKGSIITNGLINTSATAVNGQYLGNGGDVRLLANGNITFNPSSGINSVGLLGGNITLTSNGDISFTNAKINSYSYTNVPGTTGGDINVTASSIFLRNDSDWRSRTYGEGNAGKVKITARELVSVDNDNSIRSDVESGASGNSGGIELTAKTLELSGGSELTSDTYGAGSSGDVRITTSGAVKIDGENSRGGTSDISSSVNSNSTGNSGSVYLNAGSLSLTNGAQILASTFGQGNAGRVLVNVTRDIQVNGESSEGVSSAVYSNVQSGAVGNAGGVEIHAGSLSLTNGALINSSTFGQGNAGRVLLNVTGDMQANGESNQGYPSSVFSSVLSGAVGNAGGVELTAGSLSLTNGAQINSFTFGQGNAGRVLLNVTGDIQANGESRLGLVSSVFSSVVSGAVGNAGGIQLHALSLSLTNGAQIYSSTFGQGNAGRVLLNVTRDIQANGENSQGFGSGIFSNVLSGAVGDAGGVYLNAGSLSLTNGARISTSTFAQGNAGGVLLNVTRDIQANGESSQGFGSGVFSNVQTGAVGNTGGVYLNAGSLSLTNGARISTSTFAQGNAGKVLLNVTRDIQANGESRQGFLSGVFSSVQTEAVGNADGVYLNAGSLSLTNGARISTSTFAQGNAGKVLLNVTRDIQANGESRQGFLSGVFSTVETEAKGEGGNIELSAGSLSLRNGGQINSSTFGQGNAGNLKINVPGLVQLDGETRLGFPSFISSATNLTAVGNAGDIDLRAGSLELTNGSYILSATGGNGRSNAGNVTINVSGDVRLDGETSKGFGTSINSILGPTASGKAGEINLTASNLSLTNGAQIASGIFGEGSGGDIKINVSGAVRGDGQNSLGFTSGIYSKVDINRNTNLNNFRDTDGVGVGSSGSIELQAGSLSLTNGGVISANVSGQGNAGKVSVAVSNIQLDGSSRGQGNLGQISSGIFSNVESGAVGNAQGIELTADSLSVSNGAQITSSNLGRGGSAGFVTINTKNLLIRDGGQASVQAVGSQNAGDLEIRATNATLDNGIITAQTESGSLGKINLTIADSLNLRNNSRISAATINGLGGRSQINARSFNLASGSVVTTRAEIGGTAGDIEISSNQLQLRDRSGIIATTLSGNGGNIILNPKNLLLLRNNSNISTTAGLAGAGGDGGNININGGFVVAVPTENSDITANAFLGRGGNINITTNGIYGINFQNQLTPRSDITASSQFGINGIVNVDISDIDPARGLTQLPSTFLEASDQIRAGCPADRDARFVVTGRGGLPEDPRTTLRGTVVMQDFRATAGSSVADQTRTTQIHKTGNSQLPIVEAQGWVIDKQGNVELVANLPQKSHSYGMGKIDCSKLK